MKMFESLKNIFSPKAKAIEISETSLVHLPENESVIAVIPESLATQTIEFVPAQPVEPIWMEESYLRDEAVIFGLSGANADEKLAMIRYFFEEKTADNKQIIDQQEEKIGELNMWINQREDRITKLETQIEELKNKVFSEEHHLLRTIIGLCLSIGMAVGNYFLIEESLRGSFEAYRLVALGVFLAGMFNLFARVSLFHEENPQSIWRRTLEEIGMPLATSFFIFAQVVQTKPLMQAFALWAFVFGLFLFSGKLLLGNLTLLRTDFTVYNRRNQLATDKVKKVSEWETEITKLKADIEKYREEKQEILPELTQLTSANNKFNARRDRLIKLFESEFQLAVRYRNRLSGKEIQGIIGAEEIKI